MLCEYCSRGDAQLVYFPEMEDLPIDSIDLHCDVMTNFDHTIDEEVAAKLKDGKHDAGYPGWNFHGTVWYDPAHDVFKCRVKRYHRHVATATAKSLMEIMTLVSDAYGYE